MTIKSNYRPSLVTIEQSVRPTSNGTKKSRVYTPEEILAYKKKKASSASFNTTTPTSTATTTLPMTYTQAQVDSLLADRSAIGDSAIGSRPPSTKYKNNGTKIIKSTRVDNGAISNFIDAPYFSDNMIPTPKLGIMAIGAGAGAWGAKKYSTKIEAGIAKLRGASKDIYNLGGVKVKPTTTTPSAINPLTTEVAANDVKVAGQTAAKRVVSTARPHNLPGVRVGAPRVIPKPPIETPWSVGLPKGNGMSSAATQLDKEMLAQEWFTKTGEAKVGTTSSKSAITNLTERQLANKLNRFENTNLTNITKSRAQSKLASEAKQGASAFRDAIAGRQQYLAVEANAIKNGAINPNASNDIWKGITDTKIKDKLASDAIRRQMKAEAKKAITNTAKKEVVKRTNKVVAQSSESLLPKAVVKTLAKNAVDVQGKSALKTGLKYAGKAFTKSALKGFGIGMAIDLASQPLKGSVPIDQALSEERNALSIASKTQLQKYLKVQHNPASTKFAKQRLSTMAYGGKLTKLAGGGGIMAEVALGAGSGALAGSVVPGWGTAAGAVIGGVSGLVKGLSNKKQDKLNSDSLKFQEDQRLAQQRLMDDAYMRNYQPNNVSSLYAANGGNVGGNPIPNTYRVNRHKVPKYVAGELTTGFVTKSDTLLGQDTGYWGENLQGINIPKALPIDNNGKVIVPKSKVSLKANGGEVSSTAIPDRNSISINPNAEIVTNNQGTTQGSHEQGNNIPITNEKGQQTALVEPGEIVMTTSKGEQFALSKRLGFAQKYQDLDTMIKKANIQLNLEKDNTKRGTIARNIDKVKRVMDTLPQQQEVMKQQMGIQDSPIAAYGRSTGGTRYSDLLPFNDMNSMDSKYYAPNYSDVPSVGNTMLSKRPRTMTSAIDKGISAELRKDNGLYTTNMESSIKDWKPNANGTSYITHTNDGQTTADLDVSVPNKSLVNRPMSKANTDLLATRRAPTSLGEVDRLGTSKFANSVNTTLGSVANSKFTSDLKGGKYNELGQMGLSLAANALNTRRLNKSMAMIDKLKNTPINHRNLDDKIDISAKMNEVDRSYRDATTATRGVSDSRTAATMKGEFAANRVSAMNPIIEDANNQSRVIRNQNVSNVNQLSAANAGHNDELARYKTEQGVGLNLAKNEGANNVVNTIQTVIKDRNLTANDRTTMDMIVKTLNNNGVITRNLADEYERITKSKYTGKIG
jgi:hypothetical protein